MNFLLLPFRNGSVYYSFPIPGTTTVCWVRRCLFSSEPSRWREPLHSSQPDADHKTTGFGPDGIIRMRLLGNAWVHFVCGSYVNYCGQRASYQQIVYKDSCNNCSYSCQLLLLQCDLAISDRKVEFPVNRWRRVTKNSPVETRPRRGCRGPG